jgi:predicted peroxiredoxin
MPKLVIEITHAPYGRENAYAGLFIAMAWVSVGNEVIVVLHSDGVYAAKKGQQDPMKEISLPSVEKQVMDIIGEGGRVVADRTCVEVRGLDLEMLVKGVEVIGSDDLVKLVYEEGERVLTL